MPKFGLFLVQGNGLRLKSKSFEEFYCKIRQSGNKLQHEADVPTGKIGFANFVLASNCDKSNKRWRTPDEIYRYLAKVIPAYKCTLTTTKFHHPP